MRSTLRRIHRWLAIGCALLWLSQAATGLLMVYRWELDDVALRAVAAPLDVAALGARIEALGQRTSDPLTVASLWATGGVDGALGGALWPPTCSSRGSPETPAMWSSA